MLKLRVSFFLFTLLVAVGLTIRLLTGPIGELFTGEWYRYIWPTSLVFLLGYCIHIVENWIINCTRKSEEDEAEENE